MCTYAYVRFVTGFFLSLRPWANDSVAFPEKVR